MLYRYVFFHTCKSVGIRITLREFETFFSKKGVILWLPHQLLSKFHGSRQDEKITKDVAENFS